MIKKINNDDNNGNNGNHISTYKRIKEDDINKNKREISNTCAKENNKVNLILKKEGFIDEKWKNNGTGKIDKFLIITNKNKDMNKNASGNNNIDDNTNNKHNLIDNEMFIIDEKFKNKNDNEINNLNLEEFYKVDIDNIDLINPFVKKDEHLIEIEKI